MWTGREVVRVDVRVVEDKQEAEDVEVLGGDGDYVDCQSEVSYLPGVFLVAT
jgi:hypothetical protein